jgi:hypothetical protein
LQHLEEKLNASEIEMEAPALQLRLGRLCVAAAKFISSIMLFTGIP